ncbi:MAG: tRNA uridine-5-carboxymethylaminomethyl(34) synthesis GTPase MnmE [Bacteroidota bacterium]|jgi:tRNA modification GTPase
MSTHWSDIIVALATPQGIGAIGVVRLSGNGCIALMDEIFPSKQLSNQPANTLHVGLISDGENNIDEVVVSLFKSPRSYTGEDVVEISCHGSYYIIQQLIELCIQKGARLAKPGEFTMRAFLNGKMDLVQAEAVADLIASGTKAAQETALNQVRGGFSHVLSNLREELISFSALIELELDFSQEDVEFADRTRLKSLLDHLDTTVRALLHSFQLGNVIKNGVSVAIIGKPNAGKSTLLNTLLKENRAIVSSIAGTTRDTIEEVLNIDGILFRLIDTAGMRESMDEIESIGVEKSREKMKSADIVVYLYDANTTPIDELNEVENELQRLSKHYLLVGNKIDDPQALKQLNAESASNRMYVSAKNDMNIDALKKELSTSIVQGSVHSEQTVVTNARHYQSLQKIANAIDAIKKAMKENVPGDLLAIDIRQCLYHLGEITGKITNDDQLDYIFSKFCIGK